MSDQRPIRTARRKVQRADRLGSDSFCLFCGYACLESLTCVSREWLESKGIPNQDLDRLLERHHVFGETHDPNTTVTLCLNCHREITEGLMREGISMRPERNAQKLVALVLRSSAVLFESLASAYRRWANLLENQDES